MPALNHPTGEIVWEVPAFSDYRRKAVSAHITLAVAVLAILVALRLLLGRRSTSQASVSRLHAFQDKHQSIQHSLGTAETKGGHRSGQRSTPGPERPLWADRARGFVPLRVVPGQLGHLGTPATMDHGDGGLGGTYPWSALATSRGVSTSPTPPHDPSRAGPSSSAVTGWTRHSRSPRSASRASSRRRLSGSSHGSDSPAAKENGKGLMAESAGGISDGLRRLEVDGDTGIAGDRFDGTQLYQQPLQDASLDSTIPRHFSRPPPPPPLTPPTLDGSFFPFEDRRRNSAASIPPALDMSFIHQPNPEYGGSTSADVLSSSGPQSSATAVPRRRSYAKSVPVGIPVPTAITASASSSSETMTSGTSTTTNSNTFSPSSYPPTSPLLPPPPPGQYDDFLPPSAPPEYEFVGGPGGPGVLLSQQEEVIDLQGEIISVVDGAGHGWTRHTRVYGGGVCLACVAAAARNGGHGHGGGGLGAGGMGGFYGDKVPLEDRRW